MSCIQIGDLSTIYTLTNYLIHCYNCKCLFFIYNLRLKVGLSPLTVGDNIQN